MSRGPTTFRQRDVAAAIRAARLAGLEIGQVKIEKDGTITIVAGDIAEAVPDINSEKQAIKEAVQNEIQKHFPPNDG